jgi:hypothetical protein
VGRQALDLAGGQFQFSEAEVVRRGADPGKQPITARYGDDPADADDLANCVLEAREDYRSCLDDCANAAISLPRQWGSAGGTLAVIVGSTCGSLARR